MTAPVVIAFVILGAPIVHGNVAAIAVFVALWIGNFVLYASLRCPRCGQYLMWRRRQYVGWLPKHCPNCGLSTSIARPSYRL